jgi:dephospho-CoA kinase
MQRIISLIGPAGCGKSTIATYLNNRHNYRRISFAEPLKSMLATLLRLQGASHSEIYEMLYGSQKEIATKYFAGYTPRRAMQTLGTEWRDTLAKDLWTRIWENRIKNETKIVVEDMRFLHEAQAVKRKEGLIVRIDRPFFGPSEHPSEREYLDIVPDFVLSNSRDMNYLFENLREFLQEHNLK